MAASDTAAELARLAQQLVAETAQAGGASASDAGAIQRSISDALVGLAAALRQLSAGSSGGAAAPVAYVAPVAAAAAPLAASPAISLGSGGGAAAASSGGGLKISLGGAGGASSGGAASAPAPAAGISMGGGAGAPAGGRSGLDVARGLGKFRDYVEKAQYAVPAADLAFTSKAVSIIEGLPEGERNSSKVAKLLGDCIGFIDKIVAENWAEGVDDLTRAANETQKEIADFLHFHGIQVVPVPGEGVSAAQNAGAETVELIHPGAAGTPLAVARHGLRINGSMAVRPAVLVASGTAGDVVRGMAQGIAALVKPRGGHAAEAKLRAQSIKELRNLGKQIVGADEEKQRQICQYAINSIHNCNVDKNLDGVEGKLVDILKAAGYSEIYVGLGQKFDESYSPSKYERRKVSTDKELGTIIGIQQRGFLNKSGMPVQKAIVLVSG